MILFDFNIFVLIIKSQNKLKIKWIFFEIITFFSFLMRILILRFMQYRECVTFSFISSHFNFFSLFIRYFRYFSKKVI